MSDRLRLSLRFDAAAMRGDLQRLEQADWIDHFVKQNYDGAWTVLPFRAVAGASHPIATIYSDPSAGDFVDTPLLARCPYFQRVLSAFHCPLQAARLMKLTPGSVIKPHRDHDLAAEHGKARLHIPVVTNPAVDFWLNGVRVAMQEGECWYLNLSDVHSVANHSQVDRIHLVLDVLVNEWLTGHLRSADRAVASSSDEPPPGEPPQQIGLSSEHAAGLACFRAAVQRDPSLQALLRGVEDRDAFVSLAVRLAAERGYRTTSAEIDEAMRENRRRAR